MFEFAFAPNMLLKKKDWCVKIIVYIHIVKYRFQVLQGTPIERLIISGIHLMV